MVIGAVSKARVNDDQETLCFLIRYIKMVEIKVKLNMQVIKEMPKNKCPFTYSRRSQDTNVNKIMALGILK